MSIPALSLLETRVLGVLVEKQHTVPDTYPLTLNALTAGCNQKTSRDPILNATDADALAAIDRLRAFSLIVETSGGRVMRYSHNVERVLAIPAQAVALITALMLRGPQTVGELRTNCDRFHRFADSSAVEGFLHELAARSNGALVVELRRQPGARETRWAHLLCGPQATETTAAIATPNGTAAAIAAPNETAAVAELAALRTDVVQLQEELAAVKSIVQKLCASLGVRSS